MTPGGAVRQLRPDSIDAAPRPWKRNEPSPLRSLPGHDDPSKILIDPAHTFAIHGFGKDLAASAIIEVAVHLNTFGYGTQGERLAAAFDNYKAFCDSIGKYTSITEFSLQEFRVVSPLDLIGANILRSLANRFAISFAQVATVSIRRRQRFRLRSPMQVAGVSS